MKVTQNLWVLILLDTASVKRIEKKIVNALTIDGSFIIKADSLYYFYDPSEKIYEVTSDEFQEIVFDILKWYQYKLPKKIKVNYKIKGDKIFLRLLFK